MCKQLLLCALLLALQCSALGQQWTTASPSQGRVGGSTTVTISGSSFSQAPGTSYRCIFTRGGSVVQSALVVATTTSQVQCVTQPWTHGAGSTTLTVADQSGLQVSRSGGGTFTFNFEEPRISFSGGEYFSMLNCNTTTQQMQVTLTASHAVSSINVDIVTVQAPVPGFTVSSAGAGNPQTKTFSWLPKLEDGLWAQNFTIMATVRETGQGSPDEKVGSHMVHVETPPEFIAPTPADGAVFNLAVGQEVTLVLNATDRNSNDEVVIAIPKDPGLPNGAAVTATTGGGPSGRRNPGSKTITFRPVVGQEGLTYKVCYYAYTPGASVTPKQSCTRCVSVIVGPSVPVFDSSSLVPGTVTSAVNCKTVIRLVAKDSGYPSYCASVIPVIPTGSSTALPEFSEFKPVGTAVSPSQISGCDAGNVFEFVWRPRRGQEGRSYQVCFEVFSHLKPAEQGHRRCYTIVVEKCKYCVGPSETILSAAKKFGSDWIQLWGSNPSVKTPDAVQEGLLLDVGPTYVARPDDTAEVVAKRFGVTPQSIMDINPDLSSPSDIQAGVRLCVTPFVCWSEAQYAAAAAGKG